MNGTAAVASASELGDRPPAADVVRKASVQVGGRGEARVQRLHHGHEFRPVMLLQARVIPRLLRADGRVALALIVVGRIDQGLGRQGQKLAEQAVIELVGIAGLAGSERPVHADQQGVAE